MIELISQHNLTSLHIFISSNLRYLTDLYGTEVGRMKLSQIMGCLVELRELCEKSQNEQENIRL